MRSTTRCGVCLSCLTLLVSPDSAGDGLGRARVVSRRDVLFFFVFQNKISDLKSLLVRIDPYQPECKYVTNWVVKQVALFPCCAFQVDVSNPGKPFCFGAPWFSLFFFAWHNPVALRRTWYIIPGAWYEVPGMYLDSATAAAAAALMCCHIAVVAAAAACCCCLPSCAGWQNLLLVHWIWSQCCVSFHTSTVCF